MFSLGARKFSINRNTGVPKPARRFSIGEPSLSGALWTPDPEPSHQKYTLSSASIL